ncbi:MAG: helix-turn-helix domain-containing protein [Flavobacterium sp.]|nr:helix-turn-helix domain-containing protein [Flavobacterium sp.]
MDLSRLPYEELNKLYFDNEKNQKKQNLYATAYLNKAKIENSPILKARANYLLALLHYNANTDIAIRYLDSVIKYSINSNDEFFPAAAYCEKADFLIKKRKFDEALVNYNLAEKVALKTNIDYYYVVRNAIGTTKSEELGEVTEALKLYKECFSYYKTKDFRGDKYSGHYQNIIFGIADCYKSLALKDSTTYYNKLGYQESKITKNENYRYLFILNEGANQVAKKNYRGALDSIYKALPKMMSFNYQGNVLASYYYLGKAYAGLGNTAAAVQNFRKVDSMYRVRRQITPEFVSGYPYLIEFYKIKGDRENQLKYISTFMTIDSTLRENYKNLDKILFKEYDMPHLLSEKEMLIESLQKDKIVSYAGIIILLFLAPTIGGFALYQHQLKKQHRSRFEKIMQQSTSVLESPKANIQDSPSNKINKGYEAIGIAEEVVHQILEKLQFFEKQRGFLESTITIQKVATTLNTNSKYLSKIINQYKDKSFVQYINDLRIDYAIRKLKSDPKLRNYTILALAKEFGFNNAESFSTAFYKKNAIKPTYFIKELLIMKDF